MKIKNYVNRKEKEAIPYGNPNPFTGARFPCC
jgi:hypothetical protein